MWMFYPSSAESLVWERAPSNFTWLKAKPVVRKKQYWLQLLSSACCSGSEQHLSCLGENLDFSCCIMVRYLELHLELKMERSIFWWSPRGHFSTKLNEKEINLEKMNLRRSLCLFLQFVLQFSLPHVILLQTTVQPHSKLSSSEPSPTAGCRLKRGAAGHTGQMHH